MENPRFLKIVVILLLLLNLGTLAFLFMGRPPGGRPNGPAKFLVEALNLDDAQQTQYARLRSAHQQAMASFKERNGTDHRAFFDLLKTGQPDSLRIQQAADSIAADQKQMELATFEHFRQLRSMCRPEQQVKFDAVIDEALRIMRPPPPR